MTESSLKRARFEYTVERRAGQGDSADATAQTCSDEVTLTTLSLSQLPRFPSPFDHDSPPLGEVPCRLCQSALLSTAKKTATSVPFVVTDREECLLCNELGHYVQDCDWFSSKDVVLPVHRTDGMPAVHKNTLFAKTTLAYFKGVYNRGDRAEPPSLLELCSRTVAQMPKSVRERATPIRIPPHVAAKHVVPWLPFHIIDAVHYGALSSDVFSGTVTTEVHAIALRRFSASAFRHEPDHITEPGVPSRLDGVDMHGCHNVFDSGGILHPHLGTNLKRGSFEARGRMLFDNDASRAPDRLPITASSRDEAMETFYSTVCRGLLVREDLENAPHVAVAGGAVLAALTLNTTTTAGDSAYATSDIDVFVADSKGGTAVALLRNIVQNYRRIVKDPDAPYVVVSRVDEMQNPVGSVWTCYFDGDFPPVQLITVDYNIDRLLHSFDLDCCGVALVGGTEFVASARAIRALVHGYNILDLQLTHTVREVGRAVKYANRGYPCFVPPDANIPVCDDDSATLAALVVPYKCVTLHDDDSTPAEHYATTPVPPLDLSVDQLEQFFLFVRDVATERDVEVLLRYTVTPLWHNLFLPDSTCSLTHPLLAPLYAVCRDPVAGRVMRTLERSVASVEAQVRSDDAHDFLATARESLEADAPLGRVTHGQ